MSERIYYERTDIGGGKTKVTKGPLWSGTSTMQGARPRIISNVGDVWVMGDGILRQPPEFTAGGGAEWETIPREGMVPLKRFKAHKLRTLGWKVVIGRRDWRQSCDSAANWLRRRAEERQTIRFTGHGSPAFEHGRWWIIEDVQINVTRRTPRGEVSRAEVTLQLVEASDIPATAAKKPKPKPKPKKPKPKPKPKKRKERRYKMRKGDTLWELARRYYGSPLKWRILAKRNRIKNVRRIPIGKIIYIP